MNRLLSLILTLLVVVDADKKVLSRSKVSGKCHGDCENGYGALMTSKGKYTGDFKGGTFSGEGTFVAKTGMKYVGHWLNDKSDGFGTLTWGKAPHKGKCEGMWKRDKKHGKNNCVWPSGHIYDGEWKMDVRHGFGTLIWLNQKYSGDWVDGVKLGQCKFEWPSGAQYEGGWKLNGPDGFGTYTWPDGSIYRGQWKDSKMHGQGSRTSSKGDTYKGRWANNKPLGVGKYRNPEGKVQIQAWHDGEGHVVHTKPRRSISEFLKELKQPLFLGMLACCATAGALFWVCHRRRTFVSLSGKYAEIESTSTGELQTLQVQVGGSAPQV